MLIQFYAEKLLFKSPSPDTELGPEVGGGSLAEIHIHMRDLNDRLTKKAADTFSNSISNIHIINCSYLLQKMRLNEMLKKCHINGTERKTRGQIEKINFSAYLNKLRM